MSMVHSISSPYHTGKDRYVLYYKCITKHIFGNDKHTWVDAIEKWKFYYKIEIIPLVSNLTSDSIKNIWLDIVR